MLVSSNYLNGSPHSVSFLNSQGTIDTNILSRTDKGIAVDRQKKPSVKEKLDRYKAQAKQQKEAERKEPETDKAKHPSAPKQTVHQQPKTKSKKTKER